MVILLRCLIYWQCCRKIGSSQDSTLLLLLIIWVFKKLSCWRIPWLLRFYFCFVSRSTFYYELHFSFLFFQGGFYNLRLDNFLFVAPLLLYMDQLLIMYVNGYRNRCSTFCFILSFDNYRELREEIPWNSFCLGILYWLKPFFLDVMTITFDWWLQTWLILMIQPIDPWIGRFKAILPSPL